MGRHSSEFRGVFRRGRPLLCVVFLQCAVAGMEILSKVAMNGGMSSFVLIAYRFAIATIVITPFAAIFERNSRPKMTLPIFLKIIVLTLLEPVIDQNMYYLGMKFTSATFAATMCNIIPAITFLMAWIVGVEKVGLRTYGGQAKILGTVLTVSGAMVMTLIKGPAMNLPIFKGIHQQHQFKVGATISLHDSIKGAFMIIIGCISWSAFVILQAITLETYRAELSLTAWICMMGTIIDVIVALFLERGTRAAWSITWDTRLLAILYSGTVSSGLLYYIQGIVMRDKGPVFVTTFSPLSMVIVALISFFILDETQHLGRIIGAVIIVMGLYVVVWGMNRDYNNKCSASVEEPAQETTELPA